MMIMIHEATQKVSSHYIPFFPLFQGGYVFNENWMPFLKQFQQPTGQIAVQQLFPLM